MNNKSTLTPDELVKFFLSREKRADLNKAEKEEDTPNGLMQEEIVVEPLEDKESEDALDFLQRMIMSQSGKVAEAKETLGEQLADIKEKALANIDTIKNTQLKSQPNPFIGGPLSPMLTEEGVEQEVDKIVDPMLRDPEILDIPPKLFDESAQQTEEALTDAEIADIASRAIDDAGKEPEEIVVEPLGDKGLMSPDNPAGIGGPLSPMLTEEGTEKEVAKVLGTTPNSEIAEVQRVLEKLGYKPQGVDGIAGQGTARAIRKLQKALGLEPTAKVGGAKYKTSSGKVIDVMGTIPPEILKAIESGKVPEYFDPPKNDAKVENIPDSMFEIFKEAVAQKESSGNYSTYSFDVPEKGIKKGDPLYGGANMHYLGRYQMGKVALQDVGRGYSKTLNAEFLNDPDLQDKLFKKYTLQNHKVLTKNSQKYRDMSMKEKLGVLGYAHNQGAIAAEEWLYTGVSGADSFGTKGDEYTSLIRDAFAENSPDDTPN